MSRSIDLGSGFSAVFYIGQPTFPVESLPGSVWDAYDRGIDCGITLWRGEDVVGQAPFRSNRGGPTWDVLAREPLTLRPSLRCEPAGVHGYITAGKWTSV